MGFFGLLSVLIIGGIAGWLAGRLVSGYGFGLIGNIAVGVVGAFVAQLLFPRIGLGFGGGGVFQHRPGHAGGGCLSGADPAGKARLTNCNTIPVEPFVNRHRAGSC